jgi:hypothetical protein
MSVGGLRRPAVITLIMQTAEEPFVTVVKTLDESAQVKAPGRAREWLGWNHPARAVSDLISLRTHMTRASEQDHVRASEKPETSVIRKSLRSDECNERQDPGGS